MCEYQNQAHDIQEELEALANLIDQDNIDYMDVIKRLFDLRDKVPCGCGEIIDDGSYNTCDNCNITIPSGYGCCEECFRRTTGDPNYVFS